MTQRVEGLPDERSLVTLYSDTLSKYPEIFHTQIQFHTKNHSSDIGAVLRNYLFEAEAIDLSQLNTDDFSRLQVAANVLCKEMGTEFAVNSPHQESEFEGPLTINHAIDRLFPAVGTTFNSPRT